MRHILALLVLFSGLPTLRLGYSTTAMQVSSAESRPCDTDLLPAQVQNRIKADFRSWAVQESQNLSQQARLTWTGRKAPGCPGIAVGFFQSLKQASFAVLLVPSGHPDAGYRLVAFDPHLESSTYEELIVEQSEGNGASNFFIQKVPVAKFFDEASKKKYHVQITEAILMVDSAENEYESDIYFWSKGRFRQEPVDN